MMEMYKLVDKIPVPCTIEEWGETHRSASRTLGLTKLPDGYRVSTVFLGLDHRWGDEGPPILFETMVFSGEGFDEQDMDRYCTYQEAVDGHWAMVEKHGGKKPLTKEDCTTELDEDLFTL